MKWTELRARYPQRWLLVEALNASSIADKRILDDLVVVDTFADSSAALAGYARLHREIPARELYVFHTSREQLEVDERQWLGVRVAG
jgi:hypothetical protein